MSRTSACRAILLLTVLLPGSLAAATVYDGQSLTVRHRGEARNVLVIGSTVALGSFAREESYLLDIQRVRTDWLLSWHGVWRTSVVYDHEARAGDYLSSDEYRTFGRLAPVELVNLDSRITGGGEFLWRHRLYRAYAEYDSYPVRFTLGRQLVSWGTGYFWKPTDLFNPVTFALVEPGELHGADAANLEIALGNLSQLHVVWAQSSNAGENRGALKFNTNVADYDFSVMAGRFFRDNVLGADFSGQIGVAGFRGEWLHNFTAAGDDYDQLVLGVDFRFGLRLMLTGEYLYNSGALSELELLGALDHSAAGGVQTLSSHLAGGYVDYQLHPLVHISGYLSVDLEEGGVFAGPRLSWNVRQDLDLEFGAILSNDRGEFKLANNTFFATTNWYF